MSEARWILELLGGDSRTVELPPAGTLVIGSSSERAGFVIEGQGIDEAHCAIGRTKEGDWAVKDLGSRYGVVLNGQRVAAARLKLGDQLVLGSRRMEVRPARVEAARAAVTAVGSARPSDVPERIGGYRIERLIGKGAMGAVYLAVQESLRRPVALKLLSPRLEEDRDFVQRFLAEARAAAALSHPNVVVVYDVGEEDGAHYLSMEFMAGGSLEQKLAASGPLPWKAVLTVLSDAAAGLAYAESKGIVHRDIKPANLMYSGTGTVKIADLGLATTLEQEASEAVDGRKVYGTPHFIAPEQARGQAVDHRSDLYALGATAYRLLSGKTPFEGASTREILRALQTETPRALRELVTELPPELEAVVQRLMEKDPTARFPTAEALRRECERLRLVAEHGPTLEAARGSRSQLVLGTALLAVVGGATAAWFFLLRSPREEPRTSAPGVAALAPPPEEREDASFFNGKPGEVVAVPDEEQLLRAREREAGAALRDLAPFLEGEERLRALERIVEAYPGTTAAASAAGEIEALRARPASRTRTVEDLDAELRSLLAGLAARSAPLAEELRAIEAFGVPAALAGEFAPRRSEHALERVRAAEDGVRERFAQATQLALEGRFDELRAFLPTLEPLFAGLDELPGEPSRFESLRALRAEFAGRRARIDEEERFYLDNQERAARRKVGENLGPGSGLMAELDALDVEAVLRRLEALPADLRARPPCAVLEREARLARSALESLRAEFARGGWRRKQLLDPHTRRVREVRDVRAEGLVFDKDGTLESVAWSAAGNDPEWFQQLFQARLERNWEAGETRAIAALLRLVGATRGAELAREMLDPRARGTLQSAELEALGNVFAPALAWVSADDAELRGELEHEQATARRLARALEAAQGRAWTGAVTELERVLGQRAGSLLVGLLSDGGDWRLEPAK